MVAQKQKQNISQKTKTALELEKIRENVTEEDIFDACKELALSYHTVKRYLKGIASKESVAKKLLENLTLKIQNRE